MVVAPAVDICRHLAREFAKFAPELTVAVRRAEVSGTQQVWIMTYARAMWLFEKGEFPKNSLVVLDEAHEALGPLRRKMVNEWVDIFNKMIDGLANDTSHYVFGFTATDVYYRNKKLSDLLGPPIFSWSIPQAQAAGAQCPYKISVMRVPSDIRKAKRLVGYYRARDLKELIPIEPVAENVVEVYNKHFKGRQSFLKALDTEQAEWISQYLSEHGVRARCVIERTPYNEREEIWAG